MNGKLKLPKSTKAAVALATSKTMTTNIAGNANYPLSGPLVTAALTPIQTKMDGHMAAWLQAGVDLKTNAAYLKDDTKEINAANRKAATQIEGENPSVPALQTLGVPIASTNKNPALMTAPKNLKIKAIGDGTNAKISCKKMPNAGGYYWEKCVGDPTIESNWTQFANTLEASVIMTGIAYGTNVIVRCRVMGVLGFGPYSLVVQKKIPS